MWVIDPDWGEEEDELSEEEMKLFEEEMDRVRREGWPYEDGPYGWPEGDGTW
jgi:hypothetical protein